MKFPNIQGNNLEEKPFKLPSDLEGKYNLVIVPFKRWHQSLVDSWVPFLEKLSENVAMFKFYEVPTLAKGYKVMRFMIDGGMRAGIPRREVRNRTITVYINKGPFKEQLGIKSEETIYLYLLDRSGNILWKGQGGFDPEVAEKLTKFILEEIKKLSSSLMN